MLEHLIGKRLTGLSICEPWKEPTMAVADRPPLFGGIAFEFDDLALVCKSTLRFFRGGEGSFVLDDHGHTRALGFHLTMCSLDELACIQSVPCLDAGDSSVLSARPLWRSLNGRNMAEGRSYPVLRSIVGSTLETVHLCNDPTSGARKGEVLGLTFGAGEQRLWLTYREDLDGALQVGPAHWSYAVDQIVFDSVDEAFGWLAPRAPYGISAHQRHWPTLERYLQWLSCMQRLDSPASLSMVPGLVDADGSPTGLEQFEYGMQLKLAQHPNLKRRFLSIRYPVRGRHLDDDLNFILQSLVLQYKIAARRNGSIRYEQTAYRAF